VRVGTKHEPSANFMIGHLLWSWAFGRRQTDSPSDPGIDRISGHQSDVGGGLPWVALALDAGPALWKDRRRPFDLR